MQITPTVTDSIRKFIRLTPLRSDPQYKNRIRTEFDLMEALEVVSVYFHDTKNMVGKKMYQGQPFDPIEDVKRATEEYFLTGREARDCALQRGRNVIMYHLAVVPVIEMFQGIKHESILKNIDSVLAEINKLICTMPIESHYDDAIVAFAQVKVMIQEREEKRKLEKAAKRRGKRRKKKDDLVDWVERKEKDLPADA
jgi:hypothetical protein